MKMKQIRIAAGTFLLGTALMVTGCSQQSRTDRMEAPAERSVDNFDVERAEIESDLLELRSKLDARIDEVDARMETPDLNDDRRAELIRYREDLQDRRNRIERARRDVDASRNDTWNDVRVATNNTAEDIRLWFEEQDDRLDGIFRDDANDGMNDDGIQEQKGDDDDGILQNGDIIDQDGVDD